MSDILHFPKLNGSNYNSWATSMRSALQLQFLWLYINGEKDMPIVSKFTPLQLIEHQRNTRVGKKTKSSTISGYKWIVLPWGYWMVLLILFSQVMSQTCLHQRRSGILFIRSMLKTDKVLMFIYLWRRSRVWIGMVLLLCLTILEEWSIFVIRSSKKRVLCYEHQVGLWLLPTMVW